ncbi:hypothetical protein [uncultured Sphingomonas sp.]|uniref:hypothetical protein n=1 Tax=uncultured Sphingomonas sp. TaxID=158754 RepID=UPI0030FC95B0
MTMIIDLPLKPIARSVEWEPHQPSQANRAEFGRKLRVTQLGQAAYWSAKVTYPPVIGEPAFRPWRSALLRLRGRARPFRLSACEGPQHSHYQVVVVDGGAQQGYQLALRGFLPGTGLRDGMFITVADCLLQIVADSALAGADGRLTLTVEPMVPAGLIDGEAVETRRPWAVMRMTTDAPGWKVDAGQTYTIQFDCEEA